ncbi:MAG TPA: FAD-dependent oxidoreductase [Candidatus Nitrosotenuis sp.]|nr:FAD-dependent oxidoreductase [Candidatus Nitrosotenuis sp.]
MQKFDFAIIGGGILGTTMSYWLSSLYDLKICVIEKENHVAAHASGKNTGVVHSPFYLDPQKKKTISAAALVSHDLWQDFAKARNLPWYQCGTVEVALDENQHKTLEKYIKWGAQNGIPEDQLELLSAAQISKKEPNVKCYSGLYCSRDVSTDYGILTKELQKLAQSQHAVFLFGHKVSRINTGSSNRVIFDDGSDLECKFLINCAGGHALELAKMMDLAKEYSVLHFRGEYWIADPRYANLVNTNIYTVAKFPNFPFLDPHWIKRANGQAEIGPNAVPVADPETYSGYVGSVPKMLSKLKEILSGNTRKLLLDSEFLSLVSKEWKSSLSKNAMVSRVKQFIPSIKASYFTRRGTAGIRSPVITKEGQFLSEILELETENSLHIINYNSPGATGAPAYAAFLIKKLLDTGILRPAKKSKPAVWDLQKIIEKMPQ